MLRVLDPDAATAGSRVDHDVLDPGANAGWNPKHDKGEGSDDGRPISSDEQVTGGRLNDFLKLPGGRSRRERGELPYEHANGVCQSIKRFPHFLNLHRRTHVVVRRY